MTDSSEPPGVIVYARQSRGKKRSIAEQITSGTDRAKREGWDVRRIYRARISASRYATRDREEWPKGPC